MKRMKAFFLITVITLVTIFGTISLNAAETTDASPMAIVCTSTGITTTSNVYEPIGNGCYNMYRVTYERYNCTDGSYFMKLISKVFIGSPCEY